MNLARLLKSICGRRIYFRIAFAMLLAFGAAAAQFLAAQHLGEVIDSVERGYEETIYHASVIAVSLLFYVLGTAAFTFYGGKIAAGFSRCAQIKIGRKLCTVLYSAMERMEDGELFAMLTKDIDSIRSWVGLLVKLGVLPACLGLVPAALFQWCNWKFSLIALCMIPLNALPSVFFARKLSPFHANEKKAYANVLSHFTASLQFAMLIKAFQLERMFWDKHREELGKYRRIRKKRMLFERLAEEYDRAYGHISRIVLLLMSAYFIYRGEMTIGRLTSVILCANFVGEGLKILGNIPLCLPAAKAGAARIQALLDLQDEAAPENAKQTVGQLTKGPIYEVRGLAFSYGDATVLQDVSFCVRQGEKIAVVGLSGCGKTTLFKLLSGLYTPEENRIYFRGMDVAALAPEYLRAHITATTQEAFLFQATVRDNIRVAKTDGGETELIAACKNAQLDSFIQALDCGYDTEINTTIQSISNGQMQRINLARAFYRNTDVFLLDEPVSALDSDTAQAVWGYLFSGCADKTLLVILHDLEEVCRFDKVLVLENGRPAAFGTHKELMECCGLYRSLYEERPANKGKVEA